jgi:hypothetical protein
MVEIMMMKKALVRLFLLLALCLCMAGAPSAVVEASEGERQQVVAPLDDDEGSWGILLLLAAGPAFYVAVVTRYSGSKKRHEHERETQSTIDELEKEDVFLRHVTGSSSRTIG